MFAHLSSLAVISQEFYISASSSKRTKIHTQNLSLTFKIVNNHNNYSKERSVVITSQGQKITSEMIQEMTRSKSLDSNTSEACLVIRKLGEMEDHYHDCQLVLHIKKQTEQINAATAKGEAKKKSKRRLFFKTFIEFSHLGIIFVCCCCCSGIETHKALRESTESA